MQDRATRSRCQRSRVAGGAARPSHGSTSTASAVTAPVGAKASIEPPPLGPAASSVFARTHTSLTSTFARRSSRCSQVSRVFFSGPSQVLRPQGGATSSGPHAAPSCRRLGPWWRCLGQPYECPIQLPYPTPFPANGVNERLFVYELNETAAWRLVRCRSLQRADRYLWCLDQPGAYAA